jgi:hypothetical protein
MANILFMTLSIMVLKNKREITKFEQIKKFDEIFPIAITMKCENFKLLYLPKYAR